MSEGMGQAAVLACNIRGRGMQERENVSRHVPPAGACGAWRRPSFTRAPRCGIDSHKRHHHPTDDFASALPEAYPGCSGFASPISPAIPNRFFVREISNESPREIAR